MTDARYDGIAEWYDATFVDSALGRTARGRYTEAPGTSPEGLRAKVGAVHLPLGAFVQAFLDAGFALDRFKEPVVREYPYLLALRCRR